MSEDGEMKKIYLDFLEALDKKEELLIHQMLEHMIYGSYSDDESEKKINDLEELLHKWAKRKYSDNEGEG